MISELSGPDGYGFSVFQLFQFLGCEEDGGSEHVTVLVPPFVNFVLGNRWFSPPV